MIDDAWNDASATIDVTTPTAHNPITAFKLLW